MIPLSRRPLIVTALVLAVAPFGMNAVGQAHAQQLAAPYVSSTYTSRSAAQVDPALAAAIKTYIRNNTEVRTYTLKDARTVGDTARVLVVPPADVTDPAFLFARKGTKGWTVLGIGTYFPDKFYRTNHIPTQLQVR